MKKLEMRLLAATGVVLLFLSMLLASGSAWGQDKVNVNAMTPDEIKKLSYEQLLELDLPDLMVLADKLGVSTDELLEQAFLVKTTTSSKSRETVFEAPTSTTVITSDKIMHSGATTIAELFRLVPGMIVREQAPGIYDVHMRGLDNVPPGNFNHFSVNSLTLVMVDGRPMYSYSMGGTLWETLPVSLEDIERIDIVRGASSALYGASAVTGVINIITKPLSSVLSASGRVRTYVQDKSTLSYSASGRASVPLAKGWRIGLRQHAEMRKVVDEMAYNYSSGRYMQYDLLPALNGGAYNSWDRMRREHDRDAEDLAYNGSRSLDVRGIMGDVNYDGHGVNFAMTGGYWYSRNSSVMMENYVTPLSMRTQQAGHVAANLQWNGFSFMGSYMNGMYDAGVGQSHPGVRFDVQDFNGNLEYSATLWNQLTIRPGFFLQNVVYDDSKWDAVWKAQGSYVGAQGILGGESKKMLSMALTLRLDWRPIESLRVIAAGRVDKYSVPSTYYPTWQFVLTYKPHEAHLLRGVVARANRSSFLMENAIHVEKMGIARFGALKGTKAIAGLAGMLQAGGLTPSDDEFFLFQEFYGSRTLKLLTSDFAEIGYRAQLGRVSLDLELFGSRTFNFSDLRPVNTVLTFEASEADPAVKVPHLTQTLQYKNLPLVAWQGGATLSLSYAPVSNLLFNLFGTWQTTKMDHYQQGTMFTATLGDEENGVTHTWTPAVNMGLLTEYRLLDKVHFFLETYFRSSQEYAHGVMPGVPEEYGKVRLSPYGLCNFTISYDALSNLSVQVGVRNLYITGKDNYNHGFAGREFGFTNRMRPLYQLGVRMAL